MEDGVARSDDVVPPVHHDPIVIGWPATILDDVVVKPMCVADNVERWSKHP
jgi:hypothetical protein